MTTNRNHKISGLYSLPGGLVIMPLQHIKTSECWISQLNKQILKILIKAIIFKSFIICLIQEYIKMVVKDG